MSGRRARLTDDSGAAVAEFVMTSALLVLIALMVVQLALSLHVRNTLISCAAEGARYGAREGSSPAEGGERARDLITRSLSARFAQGVSAGTEVTPEGVAVVVVEVTAPMPVVGLFGPADRLEVRGRAFAEEQ